MPQAQALFQRAARLSPGFRVALVDEQRAIALDRRRMRRLVKSALRSEDLHGAQEVTILVTGDQRMADLCAAFMGRRRKTDVLAFPWRHDAPAAARRPPAEEARLLGDVAVNAERALREARRRGLEPMAELSLYVVHGLLHLVGYDDRTPAEARRMHAREAAVLRRFGYRSVFDAPLMTDSSRRR